MNSRNFFYLLLLFFRRFRVWLRRRLKLFLFEARLLLEPVLRFYCYKFLVSIKADRKKQHGFSWFLFFLWGFVLCFLVPFVVFVHVLPRLLYVKSYDLLLELGARKMVRFASGKSTVLLDLAIATLWRLSDLFRLIRNSSFHCRLLYRFSFFRMRFAYTVSVLTTRFGWWGLRRSFKGMTEADKKFRARFSSVLTANLCDELTPQERAYRGALAEALRRQDVPRYVAMLAKVRKSHAYFEFAGRGTDAVVRRWAESLDDSVGGGGEAV